MRLRQSECLGLRAGVRFVFNYLTSDYISQPALRHTSCGGTAQLWKITIVPLHMYDVRRLSMLPDTGGS